MLSTRSRLTAVAAGAAVVTSLGAGGAVVGAQINGKNIKQASISIAKLDGPLHARINNTVTRKEIANLKGVQATNGATNGATGGTGVGDYTQVHGATLTVESNDTATATASCPGSTRPVGGGYSADGAVLVLTNEPSATGWTVSVVNFDSDDITFSARAVCARVS